MMTTRAEWGALGVMTVQSAVRVTWGARLALAEEEANEAMGVAARVRVESNGRARRVRRRMVLDRTLREAKGSRGGCISC
jgi:hypothetical protein